MNDALPWRAAKLSDVAKLSFGATPSRNVSDYWDQSGNGLAWASIADLRVSPVITTTEQISKAGVKNSSVRLVSAGTTLMSFKLTVGRVATAGVDLYTNEAIVAAKGREGVAHDRWLFHVLPRIASTGIADDAVKGRTLNKKKLEELALLLPSLYEQQRITEILDTVDGAILSTGLAIAKLEDSRRGLLRDILASSVSKGGPRGYDNSGLNHGLKDASRNPGTRWAWSNIESEFDVKAGITLGPHRVPRRHMRPYLRVADVQRSQIFQDDVAYLEVTANDVAAYALNVGDLLVVEGHANPWEIGRCALVRPRQRGLLYQNHLFRLRARQLKPEFAELWLNSEFVQSYWWRTCATSSGLNTINSRQLRALQVPIPGDRQQSEIIELNRAVDLRLAAERGALAKLQLIKQGLMDDLLTGQVRVDLSLGGRVARGDLTPGLPQIPLC